MSSVRMCDRCGDIFSERAEGWSTFTGTTRRRDKESGEIKPQTDTLDSCPDCTELMTAPPQRPAAPVGAEIRSRYEPGVPAITDKAA